MSFTWDQNTCPALKTDNLGILENISFDALKQMQITALETNTANFCRRNLYMRFLNSRNVPVSDRINKSNPELEAFIDQKYSGEFKTELWHNALLSTKISRAKAYTNILAYKNQEGSVAVDKPLKMKDFDSGEDARISTLANVEEKVACARENVFKMFSCSRALQEILRISSPHGPAQLMTPDAWKAIYESETYDKGIHSVSEAIQNLVADQSKIKPNTNIFDLMVKSFKDSGMTEESAQEATFNVLAAIANAGGNTPSRIPAAGRKGFDLSLIANGLGDLDYIKQAAGMPLFSFPKNVKATCDSSKPYHFWMAAYIGRQLVQNQKIGREDVARYMMLAEKGYEVHRDMVTGDKGGSLMLRDNFDPAHEVVRMDLAYFSVGSVFGADSTRQNGKASYNLDQVLLDLEKSARPNPRNVSSNPLEQVKTFETVFDPDMAIHSAIKNSP